MFQCSGGQLASEDSSRRLAAGISGWFWCSDCYRHTLCHIIDAAACHPQVPSESVFVTRFMGDYTELVPPDEFDQLAVRVCRGMLSGECCVADGLPAPAAAPALLLPCFKAPARVPYTQAGAGQAGRVQVSGVRPGLL